MKRINKAIELLEQGQPVYYTGTRELTFQNGVLMAQTWADYIRLDLEHGPFDMTGLGSFMQGLIQGGPTKSGHRTPAVIAELPTDGSSEEVVRTNSWMIKQVLAQGAHGILLCHAETSGGVKALVESTRYSFNKLGVGNGLDQGRRGHGGEESAAEVWGVTVEEYLQKADVWPLNPIGELLLGIKIENTRALENAEATTKVPGIAFAEWGPGDMGMAMGYPQQHDPPYPQEMLEAQSRVKEACQEANIFFLNQANEEDVTELIEEGVMIVRALNEEVAKKGRIHSKRNMPW
jgi:4-hydroxy-2-oxoheptanedioate aldolase